MKASFTSIFLVLGLHIACFAQQKFKPISVEPGVSFELATYRHAVISNIQYTLEFKIPAEKTEAIDAEESISFNLKAISQPLQLDFKQNVDHVKTIAVNGKL